MVPIAKKPTITYLPLNGADYVKNVLSPISLDTILLLTRSGWAADRVFRLTVNKINGVNNASEASGPTPSSAPTYKGFRLLASQNKRNCKKWIVLPLVINLKGIRDN